VSGSEAGFAFDRGVAVRPAGDHRFTAEVEPKWNIGSAPNGGYLLSIALSALRRELPHPDPVAVSAHFAGRISPGRIEVGVDTFRVGKGHSTGVAWLEQEGQRRVHVTGTFGDLGAMDGPTIVHAERPDEGRAALLTRRLTRPTCPTRASVSGRARPAGAASAGRLLRRRR